MEIRWHLIKGGGGVLAYHFRKKDFELGVRGEGQDTSRQNQNLN